MNYEENNNHDNMASEPSAAIYYDSSTRLRESGIIPELLQLDKTDSLWIIRFLQRHFEAMRLNEIKEQRSAIDPMFGLEYLRSIHEVKISARQIKI